MSELSFYINNRFYKHRIEPGWTSLYLIRNVLNLTGTKESCSEGDCGACTVVVGKWYNERFEYRSVNSCIYPAAKLNGCHLITIEGLSIESEMHAIQDFLLKYHGTQCGFCTPGIVMSLFALFSLGYKQDREAIYRFLEGNLCRCTGYQSILEAAESLSAYYQEDSTRYQNFLPKYCIEIQKSLAQLDKNKNIAFISSTALESQETHAYYIPESLESYFHIREYNPDLKVINGGTDVMVDVNIKRQIPSELIDISNIQELQIIERRNGDLIIGSAITYNQLYNHEIIAKDLPIFKDIIVQISSQQIRHSGTISGNIANASPVGDMACVLLALNVQLALVSPSNSRYVKLSEYYTGYKQTVLTKEELIQAIIIPLKARFMSFEKSTKRKAVDISALVSFACIDELYARFSFGGISAFPVLVEFTREAFDEELANEDRFINNIMERFTPLSDVRGTQEYRNILIKNHLLSHIDKYKGIKNG